MCKKYDVNHLCNYIEFLFNLCKFNITRYKIHYDNLKRLELEHSKNFYHFFSKTNHMYFECTYIIGIIDYINKKYTKFFKTSEYKQSIKEILNELIDNIKKINGDCANEGHNDTTCKNYIKRDLSCTSDEYKLLHDNEAYLLTSINDGGMGPNKDMRKKKL